MALTGMRGAAGRCQLAAAKPRVYNTYLLLPPTPNISKVWTKCGVTQAYQTLFPNVFFYWFYRAREQSAEPVSFSSHIKKVRSTPAQVARLHHPNFGAPVKRVPICWRDMSGAESASVGQKRKNFNLSEREELVRHLLAGSEDGVLKHGAYANPGMIMNRPLPRVGTPFFFIECDVLIHALRSTPETHTCRAVSLSRRWVRSSKISAISPTRG